MPRKYISKATPKKYSEEDLATAVRRILQKRISLNCASKTYNIPKGTLHNAVKGKCSKNQGRPRVFSDEEEQLLVDSLIVTSNWGFPFGLMDLRVLAKAYLDKVGRNEPRFTNNFPGSDWASSFMIKYKNSLCIRLSNNIKRARAAVGEDTITAYAAELEKSLSGLQPHQIFNYDESNLTDDPGRKKMIYRRGIKYPDNVVNHTKSSISLMFCCSAAGDMLPPYVVYKAEHLWDRWRVGGPKGIPCCDKSCCKRGTRYNRTSHGWFDALTFTDWFQKVYLRHADRIDGPTALIGDNLSSHFTPEVIRLCKIHNVRFIPLPPNSTHLTQPLDVSFFGPLKKKWKEILTEWKRRNPKLSAVEKSEFPKLLSELMKKIAPRMKANVVNGFVATGICPVSLETLLLKLPRRQCPTPEDQQTPVSTVMSDTLFEFLQSQRQTNPRAAPRKRTKLQVVPGRSVTAEDSSPDESEDEVDDISEDGNLSPDEVSQNIESVAESESEDNLPLAIVQKTQMFKKGDFALAKFKSKSGKCTRVYLGIIKTVDAVKNEYQMQFMRSVDTLKQTFRFPSVEDITWVSGEQILSEKIPSFLKSKNSSTWVFKEPVDVLE